MKAKLKMWPVLYVALGVAAAVAGRAFAVHGPMMSMDAAVEKGVIYVAMPLMSVFSAFTSYSSLARRSTPAHLAEGLWTSSPVNPLSNQLAQIIAFGCLGLSAVSQRADAALRMFGWLGIWTAIALVVSLSLFRAKRLRCRDSASKSHEKKA